MRPNGSALQKWYEAVLAIQKLTEFDLIHSNELLKGMALAMFRIPLLRMVIIDDCPYIAHVVPKMALRCMDNPLENSSKAGDCRAKIMRDSLLLEIEKNIGLKQKEEVSRSIDSRMRQLGAEMNRSGDYLGHHGQEFSTLLHITLPYCGSAFRWQRETAYNFSEFETMKIVERKEEKWNDMPTFDMILKSNDSDLETRRILNRVHKK